MARTCAAPGALSSSERKRIPAKWFGLPHARTYPLARMVGGKATPSPSHARNALARASQQLDRGTLTPMDYARIVARANGVLAECDPMAKKSADRSGIVADFVTGGRRVIVERYPSGYLSAWLVPSSSSAPHGNRLPVHQPGRTKSVTEAKKSARAWVKKINDQQGAPVATKKKKKRTMTAAQKKAFADRMKRARKKAAKKKAPTKRKAATKRKTTAKKKTATKRKTTTKRKATKRKAAPTVGIEAYLSEAEIRKTCGF